MSSNSAIFRKTKIKGQNDTRGSGIRIECIYVENAMNEKKGKITMCVIRMVRFSDNIVVITEKVEELKGTAAQNKLCLLEK